jgi:hypothetical protein
VRVERSLRTAALFVSPVVVVEMEFLCEIGRIREPVEKVFGILTEDHGVQQAGGDIALVDRDGRLREVVRAPRYPASAACAAARCFSSPVCKA